MRKAFITDIYNPYRFSISYKPSQFFWPGYSDLERAWQSLPGGPARSGSIWVPGTPNAATPLIGAGFTSFAIAVTPRPTRECIWKSASATGPGSTWIISSGWHFAY